MSPFMFPRSFGASVLLLLLGIELQLVCVSPSSWFDNLSLEKRLGISIGHFGTKLFPAIYPELRYDTVISPYSLHRVLSQSLWGANKATRNELSRTLGLLWAGVSRLQILETYRDLESGWSRLPNTDLVIANVIFVKFRLNIKAKFRQVEELANTNITQMPVLTGRNPPELAINEWIASVTRGKVVDVLEPGAITPYTSLMLVNAMYLNVQWKHKFQEGLTIDMPFNTSSDGVKMVPSMRQSKVFRYANHYDTEVVELMFEGDVLAMYVLLPGVNSSLVQLLEFLNDTQGHPIHPLESLLDDLEEKYVALTLPRFIIETGSVDLVEPLTSIGLKKIFDPVLADFSRISDASMHVQSVKQKSYIQVNEDGCVAAAVTVVGKTLIGGISGEVWLDVNRPFLFVIRDTNVKATLFMGAFLGQARSETSQTK